MKPDRITSYAAAQSVTEISIGSLVHAFHVPLGGHLLSLNQALILTFACKGVPSRREGVKTSCGVGNAAALLKSLSPVGARLSPMIAICVQGLLFSLGVGLAGVNLVGVAIGAILLSLWAFLHPLLMAYFVFGSRFFAAVEKLWTGLATSLGWNAQTGLWILGALVALKMLAAAGVAVAGWVGSARLESRYFAYLEKWRKPRSPTTGPSASQGILKDLLHPLFLLSFAVSVGFFVVGQNATASQTIVYVLRILAVALLISWLVRVLPIEKYLQRS